MKFLRTKRLIAVTLLALVLLVPTQAAAESSYDGYIYNSKNNDVHSINGYLYKDSIDGYNMESGPFNVPEDIFITDNDTIYVVDGGNNRIVHMNPEGKVLRIIGDKDGKGKLNGPKGVFVKSDGTIYVADTKNRRIALFDSNGKFLNELLTPKSVLLGDKFVYSPSKLVVDKRNYLIVTSDGANQGLMQIDPNGEFKGFYGANHVGFSWKRLFIKLFATDEQRSQLASVRPAEFSNLFQDKEGFIYTTTLGIEKNQLKRLSAVGVDTYNPAGKENEKAYGDIFPPLSGFSVPAFVDLTVDEKGLITALDTTTGRAFQHDQIRNLLFIFGGIGEQDGLFKTPVSIDQTSDGTMYIVDRTRNRIDRFRATPFADLVHQASALYVQGKYTEAEQPWNEVLKLNSNYDLAYRAIGKALMKAEKFDEAMRYFKLGRSQYDYSIAFKEYRKVYAREHFAYIVGFLFLLYVFLKWGLPWISKSVANKLKQQAERRRSVLGKGVEN